MEVRLGYKQTEVGVIPEDWEIKLLPEVCRFRSGKAHEQFISDAGLFVCVNSKFISTDGAVRKFSTANFCPAKKGDVLMVMSDLPNGRALAKAYLVEANDIYAVNQRICALTAYDDCPEFLFFILNRHPYFLKFDDGVSQTHLLNHVFLKCPLPVPKNVSEQEAIAAALADVDALLAAQDALIAKKRAIKQGAMQKLLTGKRRLPGFSGGWVVKPLGEIAHIKTGSRNNEDKVEGGDYPFFVRSEFVERIDEYAYDCEAILVPGEGKIGEIFHYINGRFDVHQRVYAITQFAPEVSGRFVHLYLKMHFGPWAMQNTVKATVDSLRLPTFQSFVMHLPPTTEEQAAIVDVLSDMDAEITALETQRNKTAQLKQGMMHALLTGRIRLV